MSRRIEPLRRGMIGWLMASCLAMTILALPGCGGCRPDPAKQKAKEDEKKRKEALQAKKKPKPDFVAGRLETLPRGELIDRLYKPGHWMSATWKLKANNFDFPRGELTINFIDSRGRPLPLDGSRDFLQSVRPAVLPKGQEKEFELKFYVPRTANELRLMQSQPRLRARGGGDRLVDSGAPGSRLEEYQYLFVVIANNSANYGYLKNLPSIQPPTEEWLGEGVPGDYIVTYPDTSRRIALPSSPLSWTAVAYVLWDRTDPRDTGILTRAQQEAFIDWLHWGGQIVLSGPQTLDLLRNSFLDPYLPADGGPTSELDAAQIQSLNYWAVKPRRARTGKRGPQLVVDSKQPLEVIQLEPRPDAKFVVNTGELVVERRVGRGRILATAFSLSDRRIVNWGSFDNFFNGCILRRPGRQFRSDPTTTEPYVVWNRYPHFRRDARLNSQVRLFARDFLPSYDTAVDRRRRPPPPPTRFAQRARRFPMEVEEAKPEPTTREERNEEATSGVLGDGESPWDFEREPMRFAAYLPARGSGIAGWNDHSAVAQAARNSLQRASGITVPDGPFIAKVMAGYLFCLVPLNWLVFRLMGRVEWAWFAAPLIAILGAVSVVRLAQLDIGFVRSRTEISILEVQGGYSQGHLSRYTGLYTSLTTDYEMQYEHPSAIAMPFPRRGEIVSDPSSSRGSRNRLQQAQNVIFSRDKLVRLSNYSVFSNTTGMIHSEELHDLGGAIECVGDREESLQLRNASPMDWRTAVVVGRLSGGVRMAAVGDLAAGANVLLRFGPPGDPTELLELLGTNRVTARHVPEGEVSLRELYDMALDPRSLQAGDVRMVAWTDREVQGLVVTPRSRQKTLRTILVGNLRYGHWVPPARDVNTLSDVETD